MTQLQMLLIVLVEAICFSLFILVPFAIWIIAGEWFKTHKQREIRQGELEAQRQTHEAHRAYDNDMFRQIAFPSEIDNHST